MMNANDLGAPKDSIPLALLRVQQAWGKTWAAPWNTILHPIHIDLYLNPVEQVSTVAFILLSLVALRALPSAAFGIYSLLFILPPLLSGTLISTPRYYLVVFPVFIVLAMLGRYRVLHQALTALFYTLLILFFCCLEPVLLGSLVDFASNRLSYA